jgi:hypothetical protein
VTPGATGRSVAAVSIRASTAAALACRAERKSSPGKAAASLVAALGSRIGSALTGAAMATDEAAAARRTRRRRGVVDTN